ncbi:hypothetical protein [Streptomyces sp. NPDC005374]|uniref:hypothetical protein n=1 Tax=Streptomyces sp. NPDC005374 TaxID=3364713 RepID=UPI003682DE13
MTPALACTLLVACYLAALIVMQPTPGCIVTAVCGTGARVLSRPALESCQADEEYPKSLVGAVLLPALGQAASLS